MGHPSGRPTRRFRTRQTGRPDQFCQGRWPTRPAGDARRPIFRAHNISQGTRPVPVLTKSITDPAADGIFPEGFCEKLGPIFCGKGPTPPGGGRNPIPGTGPPPVTLGPPGAPGMVSVDTSGSISLDGAESVRAGALGRASGRTPQPARPMRSPRAVPGAGLSPGGGLAKCRSRVPLVVPLMPAATDIGHAACP